MVSITSKTNKTNERCRSSKLYDTDTFDLGGDACLNAREILIALIQPEGEEVGVDNDTNLKQPAKL